MSIILGQLGTSLGHFLEFVSSALASLPKWALEGQILDKLPKKVKNNFFFYLFQRLEQDFRCFAGFPGTKYVERDARLGQSLGNLIMRVISFEKSISRSKMEM